MLLFDYIQEMMVMAVIQTSALLCWISFCGYRYDSHRTLSCGIFVQQRSRSMYLN